MGGRLRRAALALRSGIVLNDPALVPITVAIVFGIVGAVGGVLTTIRARSIASPVVDRLGEWVVSAVRALGVMMTVAGLALLVAGLLVGVASATKH